MTGLSVGNGVVPVLSHVHILPVLRTIHPVIYIKNIVSGVERDAIYAIDPMVRHIIVTTDGEWRCNTELGYGCTINPVHLSLNSNGRLLINGLYEFVNGKE